MKNVIGTVSIMFVLGSIGALPPALRRASADDRSPGDAASIEVRLCLIKAVKSATLATDRPGVLAAVVPKEGDVVSAKQVVARLMDDVAQANLEVVRAQAEDTVEIEYASKLNAVDSIEYEKAIGANRRHANAVTDMELRRKKLDEERSGLQIQKAQHDRAINSLKARQAEAELRTYRIVAPFDGVVTKVEKSRGEAVKQGDAIMEVVNTDVVRVEGNVTEQNIWSVKVGSPVEIVLDVEGADPGIQKRVFHARVGFVDVVANAANRWTRVWADVPNPDNFLRPGLHARMRILPAAPAAVKTSQTGASRAARSAVAGVPKVDAP